MIYACVLARVCSYIYIYIYICVCVCVCVCVCAASGVVKMYPLYLLLDCFVYQTLPMDIPVIKWLVNFEKGNNYFLKLSSISNYMAVSFTDTLSSETSA